MASAGSGPVRPPPVRGSVKGTLVISRMKYLRAQGQDATDRVLDRLATPELRIAGVQVDRRAAELLYTGLERQAGAGTGFLENHDQGAILQGPVALVGFELLLDPRRASEDVIKFGAAQILELKEMPQRCPDWHDQAPRNSRISGASISTSFFASASE